MRLFDVIPERLFSLFTGTNREIYAEAVLEVYRQYKTNRFGMEYEHVRDRLEELIEREENLGSAFTLEEEGTEQVQDYRGKANAILRKLQELKWIDVEERSHFQRFIILPRYAARILGVFDELADERTTEYQRFALDAHQALTGAGIQKQPALAIQTAAVSTDQLVDELSLLSNNMKSYVGELVAKQSLEDVLSHHFDRYMTDIVDRNYHRLKTSDHVSIYRGEILEIVFNWMNDPELMERAVGDLLKYEQKLTREEAEVSVTSSLQFIEETYRNLDELYEQIDLRHLQYIRSSYDRAKYLTQHSHGFDQQLADLLEHVGKVDELSVSIAESVRILETKQLMEESLLTPRQRRSPHTPQKHIEIQLSPEIRKKIAEEDMKDIKTRVTKKKVHEYVVSRMGDREIAEMKDFIPRSLEEFILMPFIYLHGYEDEGPYMLVMPEERLLIKMGDYRFDNLQIRLRREGGAENHD